jgi:hypothetical protein
VIIDELRFEWQGLKISCATFNGRSVIASGGAPFVIVPYHGEWPTFKDGLNPQCGGLPFLSLIPTAPNARQNNLPPNSTATNDNEFHAQNNPHGAVVVEKHGKGWIEPEHLAIWAKFQCGNYRYIHRWVFHADGSVHVEVGLGGNLGSWGPQLEHIHHFYFRLDLDIDSAGDNQVQRLNPGGWGLNQDAWLPINTETTNTVNPAGYTKWKIVNKTAKPNGQLPCGYQKHVRVAPIEVTGILPRVVASVVLSLLHSLRFLIRSRASLHFEILALRHQLALVNRSGRPRLRLTAADRMLWACLS